MPILTKAKSPTGKPPSIERQERIVLSDRSHTQFLAALDRPARSLPNLIKAAQTYCQSVTRLN